MEISTNLTKREAIGFVDSLSNDEQKLVDSMLILCGRNTICEIELQEDTHQLEKRMEQKYRQLYSNRSKILDKFRPSIEASSDERPTGNLAFFWLKVFKQSGLSHFITKHDEIIFRYLKDVKCKIHLRPISKFVLEFHFERNKFFTNTSLRKSFYLNSFDGFSNLLSYDGDKVVDCYGSIINWRIQNRELHSITDGISFFEFFNVKKIRYSPLREPNTSEDDLRKFILQNSLKIGIYIKDCLIPAAILYFIGEINETKLPIEKWMSDDDLKLQSQSENTFRKYL